MIVRNTLASRYAVLGEEDAAPAPARFKHGGPDWGNTRWPMARRDYECGTARRAAAGGVGWRAEVDAARLSFRPAPYVAAANDALLTGTAADGNLCAADAADLFEFQDRCPSRRCLLTGRNGTSEGMLEACCAWDTYLRMGGDGDDDGDALAPEEEEAVVIPALFLTMEQGEALYDVATEAALQQGDLVQFVSVVPYRRWYPTGHFSSVIVWALAVATLVWAARASADEYRARCVTAVPGTSSTARRVRGPVSRGSFSPLSRRPVGRRSAGRWTAACSSFRGPPPMPPAGGGPTPRTPWTSPRRRSTSR